MKLLKLRFRFWSTCLALLVCLGFLLPGMSPFAAGAQVDGLLASTSPGQASPSLGGIRVLRSTPTSLLVELKAPPLQVTRQEVAGRACSSLELEGFVSSAQAGWPQLPGLGALIGVPPGARLSVQVLETEEETLSDLEPPCPASAIRVDSDLMGEVQDYQEIRAWDEMAYQAGGWIPSTTVKVEPAGKIRSQEVARLSFAPVRYQPSTGELRLVRSLRVEVQFSTPPDPLQNAGFVDEGAFESSLAQTLLNYSQARAWRVSPAHDMAIANTSAQVSFIPERYRLRVDQDGLYKVTYEQLAAAGAPVDAWDPALIQLADGEGALPIQVIDGGDNDFNAGDYLLFIGQKLDNKYTGTNVYWVYQDTQPGLRMATLDGAPGQAAPIPPHFTSTVRIEENSIYQSSRPSGVEMDHWYWAGLQATSSTVVRDFTINLEKPSGEPLTARLRGLLRSYAADPNHRTRIYLNGTLVDEADWPVNSEYAFDREISQAILVEGANTIRVEVPVGSGINSQTVFVNWLEVAYQRTYQAVGERLFFGADNTGAWEYHLSGFSPGEVKIFDLTNPRAPLEILGATLQNPGEEWVFRHVSSPTPPRFLAIKADNFSQALSLTQDFSPNLFDPGNRADYLVITHADFQTQAQRLADLRDQQGLVSKVVDIQDIYDLFGVGEIDPLAIHAFLAYAYQNWSPPAPAYVVLLGDGHYDFRNYLKYNQPFYIPPYLGDLDPYLGETAADNRFVTLSGSDSLPDMHLGRLPASSLAEATSMVDKIIAYLDPPTAPEDWYKKTTFVTDNPDGGGDFYTLSDNVINNFLPGDYAVQKIYFGQTHLNVADTKNAIIAAINQGRLMVSYIGHASSQWWAFEKLFTKDDVPLLTNTDALTFFVPMTCLEGYYINPSANAQALAEFLIRKPGAGAIATWTPTGLGVSTGHDVLQSGLFLALFDDHVPNLGIATSQAKYYLYANAPNFLDLVDTYVLLGDPATSLHTTFQVEGKQVYLPLILRP